MLRVPEIRAGAPVVQNKEFYKPSRTYVNQAILRLSFRTDCQVFWLSIVGTNAHSLLVGELPEGWVIIEEKTCDCCGVSEREAAATIKNF